MGGDERAVAAPLLQQQQDGGGGDGERRRRRWWWGWWDGEEAAGQLAFAAPMVATSMAYYAIPLVSVMYAGRLGELELAGATLGNSWGTVTGIALMVITFHPIPFDSFIYTGLHHLKIISFLRFSNLIIDPFVNLINHLLRLRWPEMLAWPEAHRPMVSLLVSLFSFLDFFLNNKKKEWKDNETYWSLTNPVTVHHAVGATIWHVLSYFIFASRFQTRYIFFYCWWTK